MSTETAANIIFGDFRDSYSKQQTRVDVLRAAAGKLEAQFLVSVHDRATRRNSSVSDKERKSHDELRRLLTQTRLRLADEVKLLQWIRRRHNMAVISRKAHSRFLVF
ncbi:hypothetical protein GGF43_000462 [Coemansia sp. RSA 2618]|nr:hypothetical protein GGF43_000462 [Coemansia sp. RSA 2618]